MFRPTTPVESYREVMKPACTNAEVAIPTETVAFRMSATSKSTVVMVAAVPTMSVTANPVIFVCFASRVSISTVVIVA